MSRPTTGIGACSVMQALSRWWSSLNKVYWVACNAALLDFAKQPQFQPDLLHPRTTGFARLCRVADSSPEGIPTC